MKVAGRHSVPRTPEGRVRLVLRFATGNLPPLTAASVGARNAAGGMLAALAGYPPFPLPPSDLLDETHARLRHCVEELAGGRPCGVYVPEGGWMLHPPARRRAGARASAPIVRRWDAPRQGWKHLPAVVIFRLVDDLNAIGADRLRGCALEAEGGQRCGVIFLASRRQLFCSVQHAQAAAWQRYQPKRKDRR